MNKIATIKLPQKEQFRLKVQLLRQSCYSFCSTLENLDLASKKLNEYHPTKNNHSLYIFDEKKRDELIKVVSNIIQEIYKI